MGHLTASQARSMMMAVATAVINAKELLCDVDRQVGDGDHGIGMAKGFAAARTALEARDAEDVYGVFATVGRTLMRVMGGASGIIFGLLFYAGSKNRPPQPALTPQEFAALFQTGLREIQAKGQAKLGDKTIVDALAPMVDALTDSVFQEVSFKDMLDRAYQAAAMGTERSKGYIARLGKAKPLGERAIGYPDAGAVSLTLIAETMRTWASDHL